MEKRILTVERIFFIFRKACFRMEIGFFKTE